MMKTAMILLSIILVLLAAAFAAREINVRRKLRQLTFRIDQILHGEEDVLIKGEREGELSALYDEVYKMTVRMREQAESLTRDKVVMADAIADISHQLRTPLTEINLTLEKIGREDIEEGEKCRLIQSTKRSLSRIDWLVEAMLKISRIDACIVKFRSDPIRVKELVDLTAEPFLIQMELKGQKFINAAGKETFAGDPYWSREAFSNLLKNCMEHTPEGGQICVSAMENPLFTQVSVSDNGPGFKEKDLPHLFERFYKGEGSSDDSVGIGLALSQMIIKGQNGTIRAKNRPEGGALFTVRFYKSVL